jgi:Ca2+-binding RTX toxin-like protein
MPVQKKDRDTTWIIDQSDIIWTLTKNAEIQVVDQHGIDESGQDGNKINVLGDIFVRGQDYAGVHMNGATSSVLVGRDSHINTRQSGDGIYSEAAGADIVNRGKIEAGGAGIFSTTWSDIKNFGTIKGESGIVSEVGGSQIYNYGQIDANSSGVLSLAWNAHVENTKGAEIRGGLEAIVLDGGGVANIVNKGVISGSDTAIQSGISVLTLVNSGTIFGDVYMGDSSDTYDGRRGELKSGKVFGGDGNDLYFTSSENLKIAEASGLGSGHDTLFSSVDFTLSNNIENFFLTGKKTIDGTANGSDNSIGGNRGDNRLSGMDGNDALDGRGGNDILTGGAGADMFVFFFNYEKDRIADFEDGTDSLAIEGIYTQQDFDALVLVTTEKNGNLVIDLGDNQVIIADMLLSDLSYADFAQM